MERFGQFLDRSNGLMAASLSAASCVNEVVKAEGAGCRDDAAALNLKGVAMATILVAGVVGVGLPLAGRKRRALRTDSAAIVAAKAFAAGVILATGFVHILHDAEHALSSPCLPAQPWRSFPFPGFVAMAAALATLVLDFLATRFASTGPRPPASRPPPPPRSPRPRLATTTSPWSPSPRTTTRTRRRSCKHTPTRTATPMRMATSWCNRMAVARGGAGGCAVRRGVTDTRDGDRVTLGDHRIVARGVTEPLHNQAAGSGALIPPVL